MDHLKSLIREVPDFPKPGINFYDITTLLKHPEGLRDTVDALAAEFEGEKIDSVIGVEARGFIFAPALAYHLGAGFVPVRKPRKLPAECAEISYDLEYGQDTLQIHRDAVGDGHRVIIADDLLATGGTARAVVDLVEQLGGTVVGLVFVVELEFLPGREKLTGYDVRSSPTAPLRSERSDRHRQPSSAAASPLRARSSGRTPRRSARTRG
jgi:adenine phosphoribosyltransferase